MSEKLIAELRNIVGKWYFNSNRNLVQVTGFSVDHNRTVVYLNTGDTVSYDYLKKYYKEVQNEG